MSIGIQLPENKPLEAPATVHAFLIADIRGYTSFTVAHGDEAAARLTTRFATICREVVDELDGRVAELRGDEAMAVFSSTRSAVRAAVRLRARFAESLEADAHEPLRVGMGLDAGEAIPVEEGFRGAALNRAARLCSVAGPGEILTTAGIVHLTGIIEGVDYSERGSLELKGFIEPVPIFEVRSAADAVLSSSADSATEARLQVFPFGGFLGSLPVNSLVARDAQVSSLTRAVDASLRGEGRTVLLAGEPGAGKTRLAQEATLVARNRGFTVLAGRCYEAEQTVPYYPFVEALAAGLRNAPASLADEASTSWPYLGALLPELGAPPLATSGGDEQQRVLRAAGSFVDALAESSPLAIVIDDLHWADSASLKLLLHLVRQTRSSRVLILATYRDVEVSRRGPLEEALRELRREGVAERIEVRRLDESGTTALIASSIGQAEVSDEFAGLLYHRTEGNPFFVYQVMQMLVERGDVFESAGRWERKEIEDIEVPESIRSVVGQRIGRLSDEAQEALYAAAVLGQTFGFDDLLTMNDIPEDSLESLLEEAAATGVVKPLDAEHYTFDHALTQQALYQEITPRRRRKLHLSAGEAIQSTIGRASSRAAELAWHFLNGGDDERALEFALLAGDGARAVFAHAEAEGHYRSALDLAVELRDESREAEISEKLGSTLRCLANFEEAIALLRNAAESYRQSGDAASEGRVLAEEGLAHAAHGTPEDGISALRRYLESNAAKSSDDGAAHASNVLSSLLFVRGQYEQGLEAATNATALARSAGNERVLVRAEVRRATMLGNVGQEDAGIRAFEEILPLAERIGELDALRTGLLNAGFHHFVRGEFTLSRPYRRRGLEAARKMGEADGIVFALAVMAQELWASGDWDEASRFAGEATALAKSAGVGRTGLYALMWSAWLHEVRGDLEEAAREAEEAYRMAEAAHDSQGVQSVSMILGRIHLAMGRPESAIELLEPHFRDAPAHDLSPLVPILTHAYVRNGDFPQAESVLLPVIESMRKNAHRLSLVNALRVLGMLRVEQARWDEANDAFEECVSLSREIHHPHAEALGLLEWGAMHLRQGDGARAQVLLTEALAGFEHLGALVDASRARRALSQLDSRA
jgi:class 3 adenylate cyclase/tetratricopeptide (TPR) repeat protein